MSVNFIRLLELLSIEQQDDRYYLNIIITIDQKINLLWEVDAKTALQLKDACEFDGKYRYRLSLRTKSDSSKDEFQSFITKTYLDKSNRVHFSCSIDYNKQIDLLKRCTTIDQLKNLPFLYEEIPTIEPEVEEPIIEEVPSDLEEAAEDSERTQEMDNDEEIVVEEINQATETKEENASIETSDSDEAKVEATVEETDQKIDSDSEKDTSTEEVEQQELESDVVHNKKEEPTVQHKNKSKKWLIIGIISVVVIGLIIFFIFSSKTPSTDTSVEDNETSSGSEVPSHSVEDLVTFGLPEGTVALTFDNGPTKYTPKIIEILNEYEVGATFFFLDTQVGKLPKTVQFTHKNGYSIGCMTDQSMASLPFEKQEAQLTKAKLAIEEITKDTVRLYRPIDGLFNENSKNVMEKQELKLVLWNVDPQEGRVKSGNEIVEYINSQNLSGSILVFDESNILIDALPTIIETIQQQNYQIVSLQ